MRIASSSSTTNTRSKDPILKCADEEQGRLCRVIGVVPEQRWRTRGVPEYKVELVALPVTAFRREHEITLVPLVYAPFSDQRLVPCELRLGRVLEQRFEIARQTARFVLEDVQRSIEVLPVANLQRFFIEIGTERPDCVADPRCLFQNLLRLRGIHQLISRSSLLWQGACSSRHPIYADMTRFSRTIDATPSEVEAIAADLRRQREDLLRQNNAALDSSAETKSILEKLEDLRRRSEALANRDTEEPN